MVLMEPRNFTGRVWKQRRCRHMMSLLPQWSRKHVMLSSGTLTWSNSAFSLDELCALPEGVKRSMTIDFSRTPCEAVASAENANWITLRPLPGHMWSEEERHSGAGTARVFHLDVRDSGVSLPQWLQHFSEHIAFAHGRDHSLAGDEGSMFAVLGHVANSFFDLFNTPPNPVSEFEAPKPLQPVKENIQEKENVPAALRRAMSLERRSTGVTIPLARRLNSREKRDAASNASTPSPPKVGKVGSGSSQGSSRAGRETSRILAEFPAREGGLPARSADNTSISSLSGHIRQARQNRKNAKGKEMFKRFA